MAPRLRFERFEFHVASGELRRDGERIRLEPQPAKVLALLAERSGQVVSRDELRQAVWPSDTFVDFERGLNYCVAKIRAALGDAAATPRFIETLPKRGYRFLPPVEPVESVEPGSIPTLDPVSLPHGPEGSPPRGAFSRRGAWVAGAGAVLLLGILGALWSSSAARRKAPELTIAVALFDNETGRPELDRLAQDLTDAVVERLAAQGAPWSVIGNAALLRAPRPMRNLGAIRSALGADLIVIGQLKKEEGGRAPVLAHLIRGRDQKHLWVGRFERGSAGNIRLGDEVAARVFAACAEKIASLAPSGG
ncbi:MAG TPA: winged helix-turn-helix domain-containing protein [Thermoanaerobaculia bacterium]|nr:winged helix-turn-helix domain-containing protein [Thermoanaerobaculia bacterium]